MMNSHHKEEGIQEKVIVQMVDVDKKHISLFSTHFKTTQTQTEYTNPQFLTFSDLPELCGRNIQCILYISGFRWFETKDRWQPEKDDY